MKGSKPRKSKAGLARSTKARLAAQVQRLKRSVMRAKDQRAVEAQLRLALHELEVHQEEVRLQNLQLIESQKLLEESRDRYAELYDLAPVAYVSLNEKGAIVEINLRGAALLGRARPNLIQTPLVYFISPSFKRAYLNYLYRCRRANEPLTTELMFKTRENQHIPVQLSTTSGLMAETGELRLHMVVLDLSDQKRAQAERERLGATLKSEKLLREVLEALPVSVRLVDPSGRLVIRNEASRRMFGIGAEVPGVDPHTCRAWWPDNGRELGQRDWPVAMALAGGGTVMNRIIELETEPRARRKSIRSSAVPLTDEGGKFLGVVLVDVDLTEIRETQKELVTAKEAAEAASRLKDEFLATLSHELRTPISAILLWTHLLQTSVKEEHERHAAFETILANAKLQSQLINDLLDLSRVASAKLRLDLRPQLVEPVITSAIETMRPAADEKRISIETEFDPDPATARIDTVRLGQVILNLLNNAINFTPPNGKITIGVHRSGKHVRVDVTDTGKGISPEFLPHVFDRFRQAEGGSTRSHGGLGLGLAIARELVLVHGGTIRAFSEGEGRGAKFTVELPAAGSEPVNVPSNKAAGRSLQGLRILFVEDEPATRSAVTHILSDAGAEVDACDSARSALEEFSAHRPDLVISDIAMPGEDGYSLLRAIREIEIAAPHSPRHVPAIALTAYATREDVEQATAGGFNLHLSKPVDPTVLVDSVSRFVRRRNDGPAPGTDGESSHKGNGKPHRKLVGPRRKTELD